MPGAHVGTDAASVLGANTGVTPAWGTSQNRSAGNLLVCWAIGYSALNASQGVFTISSGWQQAAVRQGSGSVAGGANFPAVAIFYKTAAGGDAAPTVTWGSSGTNLRAGLAEFSGANAVDRIGSNRADGNSLATNTLVVTLSAADAASSEVIFAVSMSYFTTGSTSNSETITACNNATLTSGGTKQIGASNFQYGCYAYGITTSNAGADTVTTSSSAAKLVYEHIACAASFSSGPVAVNLTATAQTTGQASAPVSTPVNIAPIVTHDAIVIADGPIGFWPLNEPSNAASYADQSGNGRNATPTSAVLTSVAGIGDGEGATFGFSGSNYINVPSSLSIPAGSAITVEFWTNPAASPFASTAYQVGVAPNYAATWAPYSDSQIYWDYGGNSGSNRVNAHVTLDSKFHHIVCVASTNFQAIYFDGSLLVSAAAWAPPAGALVAGTIGYSAFNGSPMNYALAKLAVYNYALSAGQVLNHFAPPSGARAVARTAATAVITTPMYLVVSGGPSYYDTVVLSDAPKGFWPFNDGSGSTSAADATGGNHPAPPYGLGATFGLPGIGDGERSALTTAGRDYDTTGTGGGFGSITPNVFPTPSNVTAFTMEMWANATGAQPADLMSLEGSGNYVFQLTDSVFYSQLSAPTSTPSVGFGTSIYGKGWSHVVGTWDGANMTAYINGVSVGQIAATGLVNLSSGFITIVGGNFYRYTPAGNCAKAAVYDYALTAARVLAHFQAASVATPVTGPRVGTVASATIVIPAPPAMLTVSALAVAAGSATVVPAARLTATASSVAQAGVTVRATTLLTVSGQSAAQATVVASTPVFLSSGQRTYDSVVLADSPRGFWPLNDAAGSTTFADLAHGNTAMPNSSNTGTPTFGVPGIGDGETAALLPGGVQIDMQSYQGPPPAGNNQVFGPAGTLVGSTSIELWLKVTASGYYAQVCAIEGYGAGYCSFRLEGPNAPQPADFQVNGNSQIAVTSSNVTDGSWHQIVGTFDAATGISRVYLDGSLQATNNNGGGFQGTTTAVARVTLGLASSPISDTVAKYSVYDYPLTAAQVTAHYNAAGPPSALPVQAIGASRATAAISVVVPLSATASGASQTATALTARTLLTATAAAVETATASVQTTATLTATATSTAQASTAFTVAVQLSGLLSYDQTISNESGLRSFWKLKDATATATDSVDSNPGTYTGGYSLGQPGIDGGVGSVGLDGVSGYVSVPANVNLRLAAVTVEAWIYPTSGNEGGAAIVCSNQFTAHVGYELGYGPSGSSANVLAFASYDGTAWHQAVDAGAPSLNQWHHIVGTYDGTTLLLYRDGVQVASNAWAGPLVYDATTFTIGLRHDTGLFPYLFQGRVAKVVVYTRALTPAQVLAHYNARGTGATVVAQATATVTSAVAVALTASSQSSSAASATVTAAVPQPLSASASAVTAVVAAISPPLTATAANKTASTANLTAATLLSPTAVDTTVATAALSAGQALTANGQATTAAAVAISAAASLTATGVAASTASVAVTAATRLVAASQGISAATSTVSVQVPLTGTASATSAASLTIIASSLPMMFPVANATATATGTATTTAPLVASSQTSSTATGTLKVQTLLTPIAVGTSASTATTSAVLRLTLAAAGVSTATATVVVAAIPANLTATSSALAASTLTVKTTAALVAASVLASQAVGRTTAASTFTASAQTVGWTAVLVGAPTRLVGVAQTQTSAVAAVVVHLVEILSLTIVESEAGVTVEWSVPNVGIAEVDAGLTIGETVLEMGVSVDEASAFTIVEEN